MNNQRRPKSKGRATVRRTPNVDLGYPSGKLLPLTRNVAMTTFRQPGAPPSMDIQFKFPIIRTLASASPNVSLTFTVNSVWDVDPLFGSTSTPYLSEWAAFYNTYRVVAVKYRLTFSSEESFAVTAFTQLNDTDPGTSMTMVNTSNPLAKWAQLGLSLNTKTLSAYHTVSEIVGSNAVEFDDKYAAGTNGSNPSQLVWLGVGVQALTGANLTNGVSCSGEIIMYTRLSGRNIVLS